MPNLFVDADACPVKQELVRVAERHGLIVHMVSNRWVRGDAHPLIQRVVVADGPDVADDWIAERIGAGDIVITADIPLAARCVGKGARALTPTGRILDGNSIGLAVATRDLMTNLRDIGVITSGPAAFSKKDRSRFLDALEATIQAIGRGGK